SWARTLEDSQNLDGSDYVLVDNNSRIPSSLATFLGDKLRVTLISLKKARPIGRDKKPCWYVEVACQEFFLLVSAEDSKCELADVERNARTECSPGLWVEMGSKGIDKNTWFFP